LWLHDSFSSSGSKQIGPLKIDIAYHQRLYFSSFIVIGINWNYSDFSTVVHREIGLFKRLDTSVPSSVIGINWNYSDFSTVVHREIGLFKRLDASVPSSVIGTNWNYSDYSDFTEDRLSFLGLRVF
jgi:hypothetical protein